jgi:RNA polymerase sigma factor (sigma-70 family)
LEWELDGPRAQRGSEENPGVQDASGPPNNAFPEKLSQILDMPAGSEPERAWDAFLSSFGDLLLKTAAYAHRGHDPAMDAYAFILEKLREDDFRRLRKFSGGDGDAFKRWLVVVARRLCSDLRRQKYGRVRLATPEVDREVRRRLVDEIWDVKEPSELPAGVTADPEWELRLRERRAALKAVVEDLDSRDRLLLAFRFEDGLSARRIAELMDFSTPFHVYRRLNRVLAALREELRSMGVEGPGP